MNEEYRSHKKTVNVPLKQLASKPITIHEIENEIKKRVSFIDKEFTTGFEFIKNQVKSVSFFGSARFNSENIYYKKAESLAARIATLGYTVVSGGGPGIMEASNRGAKEAGGVSLGFTISLPNEQIHNPYLTDHRDFYYFFTRKVMMSFSAEAYIFFPGGFGTLDEFFEILTLVQTHKIERVPIFLVGVDYWRDLNEFIEKTMFRKSSTVDRDDMNLYIMTDNEDLICDVIKNTPVRYGVRISKHYGNTPYEHKSS